MPSRSALEPAEPSSVTTHLEIATLVTLAARVPARGLNCSLAIGPSYCLLKTASTFALEHCSAAIGTGTLAQ
jgi:hypothetical protein